MTKHLWSLILLLPVTIGGEGECRSALARAQALEAPQVASVYGGEMEGSDFWLEHDELFEEARKEWGRKHEVLYHLSDEYVHRFLDPKIKDAIQSKSVAKLEALFQPSEKEGVHKIQLFTSEFIDLFLEELAYQEESNIPMRRPNGMNRYGCLLSQLGFGDMVKELSDRVLRPMAHILFPDRVAVGDIAAEYGFMVQYHPDADVNLAEHADASAITINVCLQPSTEHSPLYFKNVRELGQREEDVVPTNVSLDTAGMAVIHLGQHLHGVSKVTSARSNMVVWLMGDYDYVRVAPYEDYEVVANRAKWRRKYGWN